MALRAIDRRGLGEIIAWSCASFMVGLVLVVKMIVSKGEVDGVLMGQFVAIITILIARGTQGAAERSARADQARAEPPRVDQDAPTPLPPPFAAATIESFTAEKTSPEKKVFKP